MIAVGDGGINLDNTPAMGNGDVVVLHGRHTHTRFVFVESYSIIPDMSRRNRRCNLACYLVDKVD